MKLYKSVKLFTPAVLAVTLTFMVSAFSADSIAQVSDWKTVNEEAIDKYNIVSRERSDMIDTSITSNLVPGEITSISSLTEVEFVPGVTGRMYWGRGALINFMHMEPGSEIPQETIPTERIMVMMKGSVEQLVNGKFEKMVCTDVAPMYYFGTGMIGNKDCLYLEKGAGNAVKAGPRGAEFIEVYSPVRLDYIEKTGMTVPGNVNPGNFNAEPNFPPNKIFNYHDIQLTEIAPEAWSKLINGKCVQLSFTVCESNSKFPIHNHPEEQIMAVLRGSCEVVVMGTPRSKKSLDVVYYPSNMVHCTNNGARGCEALDVFWPVRADYLGKMKTQREKYYSIIPSGEKPILVADGQKTTAANSRKKPGLQFTEGPVWMDGTLYFSSMFFDIPAGTWKSDERKSDLVAMKSDGTYKYIIQGIQTNGLMAKGNGNLVACDMNGHRVIEVSPDGRVVNTLSSIMKSGVRLDGPNDLVIDARGGIYFTDPQFIFTPTKRPWKTVNYIKPDTFETICVIENENNMEYNLPNGILLSPDGKTSYVNNTYHMCGKLSEAENWIFAYDVNEDGTLSNKRKFVKLFLPPQEIDTWSKSSCADGMTMDEHGNLYFATNTGLQIFNPEGGFIGNVHVPVFPVSCCFGGDNYDTVYMTCWDRIYSIKTNVKGLEYPLKK